MKGKPAARGARASEPTSAASSGGGREPIDRARDREVGLDVLLPVLADRGVDLARVRPQRREPPQRLLVGQVGVRFALVARLELAPQGRGIEHAPNIRRYGFSRPCAPPRRLPPLFRAPRL